MYEEEVNREKRQRRDFKFSYKSSIPSWLWGNPKKEIKEREENFEKTQKNMRVFFHARASHSFEFIKKLVFLFGLPFFLRILCQAHEITRTVGGNYPFLYHTSLLFPPSSEKVLNYHSPTIWLSVWLFAIVHDAPRGWHFEIKIPFITGEEEAKVMTRL